MNQPSQIAWNKFATERAKPLWNRFPGKYRAIVMETNDPLQMHRIRVLCPELHDADLAVDDCPWALPVFSLGGSRAGQWVSPTIGDTVFISFEKNHPYSILWEGAASPTRRKQYPLASVSDITPIPVNIDGANIARPTDYDKDYLPADGRPMTQGLVDRYGHLDLMSSIGYFPEEHNIEPPPPDHDPIQGGAFQQSHRRPEVNQPDRKYMARVTKYGMIFIMSDQGYEWQNEFTGNHETDEKFEIKRWLKLQRILNNNMSGANSKQPDQRRIELRTRYGSRIELGDTGWAQVGPIPSKTREGEYGPRRYASLEDQIDARWIKIRTKGGWLMQFYDKGFHPENDKFIKRNLVEEVGMQTEQEDKYFGHKDARFFRVISRYGMKFVMDDRGSHSTDASNREHPRANGILIKGRRSPGVKNVPEWGDARGFFWEFNENDEANHTTWGTPMGLTAEFNDRYQYMMLAASMGTGWSRKHMGHKENEFLRKPTMIANPERNSHHLKLDHDNEYIRFKTRAAKGPDPRRYINPTGVRESELNQGVEARDGRNGDGPWCEIVDCQGRGMWFSKNEGLGVWRAKKGRRIGMWLRDVGPKTIVLYNGEGGGKVQIYSAADIELVSARDITFQAGRNINLRAENAIRMQGSGTKLTVRAGMVQTNRELNADTVNAFVCGVFPGPGGGCRKPGGDDVLHIAPAQIPSKLAPTDRGKTYNGPFEECPLDEVEHPIQQTVAQP